jgi:hypothetical protein
MSGLRKLLAGAALSVAAAGSALAADVVVIPPPAPPPPPMIAAQNLFEGPYWGVYGGIWNGAAIRRITPLAGTQFGYNFLFGNFMAGFEIETEWLSHRGPNPRAVDATLSGRWGVTLGNAVLLYGQAGVGTFYATGTAFWSLGGGAEVALGTSGLTLFAEAKRFWPITVGPAFAWTIRGGVNYYADPSNAGPTGMFDWGGHYFGTHVGHVSPGVVQLNVLTLTGVQVGYNLGSGPFVAGPEVETSWFFGSGPFINAALNGRAGFVLGSILLYGEVGIASLNRTPIWTIGGGAELALGNQMGVFAEAKALSVLGGGGFDGFQINGGVNIHFGR